MNQPIAAGPPLAAMRRATRLAFFVCGTGVAAWAPMVPQTKLRLGLDDAELGLVLLCLGGGAMVAMPLAGALLTRMGCRALILAAGLVLCLTVAVLPVVPTAWALAVALIVFGGAVGVIDVAVNVQAVIAETLDGRPLMSGFHALFSIGGLVGSAGVSALVAAGLPLAGGGLVVSVVLAICLALALPGLATYGNPGGGDHPAFAVPRGVVVLLGLMCFVVFLAEGAMLDWSGVFLRFSRGFDEAAAGLGYAAFAVAMAFGRLFGDRLVGRLGPRRTTLFGCIVCAGGFAFAALVPSGAAALAGFALVGLGASNVVPVLFSAAGRQTVMPPSLSLAAVTSLGYAGMLLGPALIGFAADRIGLSGALCLVAALLLVVAAGSRLTER